MSEPATVSTPAAQGADPAPAAAEGRGLLERQLQVLGRLAEAGLNIALAVERQAMGVEAGAPDAVPVVQGDLALAYGRVARAVRLTIALQAKLLQDLQAVDEGAARRRAGEAANANRDRKQAEAERKGRVERIVERLIREEARDEAEGDRLAEEAYERLEHDDIYGDLLERPASEIIALVCKDLGLAPDWSRLAEEAWAQEELASGPTGAPLARFRWLDPPGAAPDEGCGRGLSRSPPPPAERPPASRRASPPHPA